MNKFAGFGPKALPFFKGIAFHQNKEWFEANRGLYESDVVEPMIALLEDLSSRFAKAKIPLKANGKKSIFRINRDVRFSKDKSPYKTHMGAVMTRSGTKNDPGLLYIHISPDGCFVAAGFHMPEAPQLLAFRNAIKAKPDAFRDAEAALKKGKLSLSDFDQLSRVPRGFESLKGGPLEDAIRKKSFIVEEAVSDKLIQSARLADTAQDFAKRAMPLLRFGWAAVG